MSGIEETRYFIVKDRKDLTITYLEFDKIHGYDLQPRNVKIKDAVDVNKMVIINPSLIEKLAFRKVNYRFQRIVKLLMFVLSSENDDDTGSTYHQALNEVNKFRLEFLINYRNKLKEIDFEYFNKKLDLMEQELKNRLYYLQLTYQREQENLIEREGKSR